MNKQDEDKLLKIANHAFDTSVHVGNVAIQPSLPGSNKELGIALKPSKTTSLKVKFKRDGAQLTFTKKF